MGENEAGRRGSAALSSREGTASATIGASEGEVFTDIYAGPQNPEVKMEKFSSAKLLA